jgi:hypothetical protein
MSDKTISDAWITSSAALLELPIDPAWLPDIRTHLEVTFGHAKLFDAFPLPDDAEPGPVFGA